MDKFFCNYAARNAGDLCLPQLIDPFPAQLHRIFLTTQAYAFIDDLFIGKGFPGNERHLFYQLKTGRNLAWGNGHENSSEPEKVVKIELFPEYNSLYARCMLDQSFKDVDGEAIFPCW